MFKVQKVLATDKYPQTAQVMKQDHNITACLECTYKCPIKLLPTIAKASINSAPEWHYHKA